MKGNLGIKKNVRIGRFAHFNHLRDRLTNQPTNRPMDLISYRSARTLFKGKQVTRGYDIFVHRWAEAHTSLHNHPHMRGISNARFFHFSTCALRMNRRTNKQTDRRMDKAFQSVTSPLKRGDARRRERRR